MTSRGSSPELVAALRQGLAQISRSETYASVFAALYLDGVDFCDDDAYRAIMEHQRDAERLGYPVLA